MQEDLRLLVQTPSLLGSCPRQKQAAGRPGWGAVRDLWNTGKNFFSRGAGAAGTAGAGAAGAAGAGAAGAAGAGAAGAAGAGAAGAGAAGAAGGPGFFGRATKAVGSRAYNAGVGGLAGAGIGAGAGAGIGATGQMMTDYLSGQEQSWDRIRDSATQGAKDWWSTGAMGGGLGRMFGGSARAGAAGTIGWGLLPEMNRGVDNLATKNEMAKEMTERFKIPLEKLTSLGGGSVEDLLTNGVVDPDKLTPYLDKVMAQANNPLGSLLGKLQPWQIAALIAALTTGIGGLMSGNNGMAGAGVALGGLGLLGSQFLPQEWQQGMNSYLPSGFSGSSPGAIPEAGAAPEPTPPPAVPRSPNEPSF